MRNFSLLFHFSINTICHRSIDNQNSDEFFVLLSMIGGAEFDLMVSTGLVVDSVIVGDGICVSIATSSGNGSVRGGRIGWTTGVLNVEVGITCSIFDGASIESSGGSSAGIGTNGIAQS